MQVKFLILLPALALGACQTTGTTYRAASDPLPKLDVQFASAAWDGKAVPKDGICQVHGGRGDTPELKVSGIPAGANAVIVEFSDRSFAPMDNGGHGIIGWKIEPGATTATLKPVPGMTSKVADGTWIEGDNRSSNSPAPGYRGPCSGGRGNTYEADVKAVYKPTKDGEEGKLLAKGRIRLGTF